MKVKLILPALTEATSQFWRSIKYSLFPPLGLAILAGYLDENDDVEIADEHVEILNLEDKPDLVAIQVYVTSAYRAYEIADHYRQKGVYVVLGGLHVTSLPKEALQHADAIFLGPGEDTWPRFLADFKRRRYKKIYRSTVRNLVGLPMPRRDLIKRHLYFVPNSIVVSRGCPYDCDFCYKGSFFKGGKSFYTFTLDRALAEIDSLMGRHLFFLDDNIFASSSFAEDLFSSMAGMGRLWQGASTVGSIFNKRLLQKAVNSGLRSLFIGFETLNIKNLQSHNKNHNIQYNYEEAVRILHDHQVMINASFVFGMDADDESVFERTVDWSIKNGIETATFHILTPYPGTHLFENMSQQGRITSKDWDLYDTRHVVFKPLILKADVLESGYWYAYKEFYKWKSIFDSAWTKRTILEKVCHLIYSSAWKKSEWIWNALISMKIVGVARPILETILRESHFKLAGEVKTIKKRLPEQSDIPQ